MSRKKYIFVVGGVMSGVGKGVASSSIANILKAYGLKVTALKIDPYVNVDAGTMNPTEHGEVFVLEDGTECDQDMGNYERFLGQSFSRANYMTTGSVYLSVIEKERNLEYGGRQVEVVPRIPLEVIERIDAAIKKDKAEIAVVEIGGTVGEYENILFLEAVRMLKIKNSKDILLMLVSYLPALGAGGTELKTKPTQHAVRSLNAVGIHPDMIFGRASAPLDEKRKEKIEFMCSMQKGDVISAPNVESIYEVPVNFEKENVGKRILKKLGLKARKKEWARWEGFVRNMKGAEREVNIGIVGKYFGTGEFILEDSYISVIEAIKHAAYAERARPIIHWVDAEEFASKKNKNYDGIIVPGGFGSRAVEGKIEAIRYARENKTPYFGLCYGMQLMVVEHARNIAGLKDAHTTEVNTKTPHPVIDILPEQKERMKKKEYGGTMRLGAYPAMLKPGTIAYEAYVKSQVSNVNGQMSVSERHRHRYEVNPEYIEQLEKTGLVFSGVSPNRRLMEIAELPKTKHPFFLGTQFHPEFTSRPLSPQPLFHAFIKAALVTKK